MKVTTFVFLAVFAVILGAVIFLPSNPKAAQSTVPTPPLARTGAPPTGNSCVACHSGNSGDEITQINVLPPTAEYVPGNTYSIGIGIEDPGKVRWGFEATVLKDSDDTMAGSLSAAIDAHTTVQSSGGISYIMHTTNGAIAPGNPLDGTWWGTADGPVAWIFLWTAPPQGTGSVTFYAATVAADGDGGAGAGDNTYTPSLSLTEAVPTPVTSTTWGKIKKRYK